MTKDYSVPNPGLLSEKYMVDKNYCHQEGDIVACFDPENMAGGFINVAEADPYWILFRPITATRFASMVSKMSGYWAADMAWSNPPVDKKH